MTNTNPFTIAVQVRNMFDAGGFYYVEDIGDFVRFVKMARRIAIVICHDKKHPAIRQIDEVMRLAINIQQR